MDLSLSCCNLTRSDPIRVGARGFGLSRPSPGSSALNSVSSTSVGLGFGLRGELFPFFRSASLAPPNSAPVPSSTHVPTIHSHDERLADDSSLRLSADSAPTPLMCTSPSGSFLSALTGLNGFGRSVLDRTHPVPAPTPRVRVLNPSRFRKLNKNLDISLIRFHPVGSPAYTLASMGSTSSTHDSDLGPDNPDEPHDSSALHALPPKYMPWASTVFSDIEVNTLPPHRPYDISIDLEDGKSPPFGPMYRLSQDERDTLAKYLDENLRKGFIRRSTSSAAAPILFARKKSGDLRLCVDYRGLNSITKKNRYPLPLIDDLLDRTQGCKVFSVIDLKNAFNLVRVKEGDEWKTAFRTPLGLFETLVMPFGLSNAPSTFQAFIIDTLRDYLDVFCVVYLDDILIFSRSQEEHDEHVKKVLDRLQSARLFANPEKCEFDRSEVTYLGYVIGADGIKMDPKKLDTVRNWPEPRSVKDIQSFLGFTNFYRRFVDHYSFVTLPLTSLCKKDVIFQFSASARAAFDKLKAALLSQPVLRHFDPTRPSTLATDASDFALAGVLMQPDDEGHLHPVAFYSRKFTPAEINYEVYDKELLAVVESFRDMRAWLIGTSHPVSVISDHKNLEYFMSTRVLNRRQVRWSMFLSEFDFKLSWGPGVKNVADAPSRRPDFVPQKGDETSEAQFKTLLRPYHTELLFPDRTLVPSTPSSPPPSATLSALTTLSIDSSELLKRFQDAWEVDQEWREALTKGDSDFVAERGMVYHKGRLFVPEPLRADVLHSRHDSVAAGHPGRTRTLQNVQRDYSWPGLYTRVRKYVDACDLCHRIQAVRHRPYGPLQPLDIPTRPWLSISMDFIVKLPDSHGYDSIFVVCDRLTRAAHFIPCKESINAPELAWLFLDRIFRYHGLPESIISDRGAVFISQFWSELTRLLQVDVRTSTAYHPQTDGLTERTNQTLETYLRAYVSYQQDDWVDYLPLAEFAFNNSVNSSTQQSPFFANTGFHPTFEPRISEAAPAVVPAAADLATRLERIHLELQAELKHAQEVQARAYDRHHDPIPPDLQPGRLLDHRRLGPYPIECAVGTRAFKLRLPSYLSRLHPVFHISLLEPYNDPSEFHPHADPQPFELLPDDDPATRVAAILDARKTGRRFEYLVHFTGASEDEDAWVPLSDIPRTADELLERFHRRHPRAPRPQRIVLEQTYPIRFLLLLAFQLQLHLLYLVPPVVSQLLHQFERTYNPTTFRLPSQLLALDANLVQLIVSTPSSKVVNLARLDIPHSSFVRR
ncbi:Transposon Tf2-12 polyprotein [Mycena sanguinolenta]|uniref:Transposon Tf2-12 polyprotein n=1 Tax=Mycena sanguinolenta TaxID=230812 RepID=A0A8H7CJU1_9AGAR|nr:Transposon Tf2-12 polyprotein [Mycena sanguinolenta]